MFMRPFGTSLQERESETLAKVSAIYLPSGQRAWETLKSEMLSTFARLPEEQKQKPKQSRKAHPTNRGPVLGS